MIKLAFYNNDTWWDLGAWLIKFWTKSDYSHVEIIIGEYSYSSSILDNGVRKKHTDDILKSPEHWCLIDVCWVNKEYILTFFEETEGTPYGWVDLILRQVFHLRGDSKGMFCSEWVAKAIQLPNSTSYSPQELKDTVEFINAKINNINV